MVVDCQIAQDSSLPPASSSTPQLNRQQQPQLMTQNGHLVSPPAGGAVATSAVPRALPQICYTLRRKVDAFLEKQPADDDLVLKSTQKQARHSIEVIEEALRRYSPDELSLSYNGGKDCLVLLILILACLPARHDLAAQMNGDGEAPISKNPPPTMQAVYIAPPDPFPEVEDFVSTSTKEYHLNLASCPNCWYSVLDKYGDMWQLCHLP